MDATRSAKHCIIQKVLTWSTKRGQDLGADVGLGVMSGVLGTRRRSFGLRDNERCK